MVKRGNEQGDEAKKERGWDMRKTQKKKKEENTHGGVRHR